MGVLGHDTRNQGDAQQKQLMRNAADHDGIQPGVAEDNFIHAVSGGVAVEGGFHVGIQVFADVGEPRHKLLGEPPRAGARLVRGNAAVLERLADLLAQMIVDLF